MTKSRAEWKRLRAKKQRIKQQIKEQLETPKQVFSSSRYGRPIKMRMSSHYLETKTLTRYYKGLQK